MGDRYEQLGVSATKQEVHRAVNQLPPSEIPNSFVRISQHFTKPESYMSLHTDTAGTKPILAYLMWKETGNLNVWQSIAVDALVMNTDDLLCNGFVSQFAIVNNIARNKHRIPGVVLEAIIQGTLEFINQMKEYGVEIKHLGGETADVGDLVRTIDVGFSVYSEANKDEIIPTQPREGNVIVGLASFGMASYETSYNSGIGSNGITLARHTLLNKQYAEKYPETVDDTLPFSVIYQGPYYLGSKVSCDLTIADVLLAPTRTYLPLMINVLRKFRNKIDAIIHCTGGGQTKVFNFIKDKPLRVVKDSPFAPPIVFRLIQETGEISWKEMYQVFNMGWRMEIYTDRDTAEKIIEMASEFDISARIIGYVASDKQPRVIIRSPDNNWLYYE